MQRTGPARAAATPASGPPTACLTPARRTSAWVGLAPVVYGGNLTGTISAPKAAGNPSAFANAAGVNIVVYRSTAGEILSVYWSDSPSALGGSRGGGYTHRLLRRGHQHQARHLPLERRATA